MSYSSYQQPTPGTQLPPCVPMNPGTKTGRTVAKPTKRDELQKRAYHVSYAAALGASSEAPFYTVCAYDPIANIATIQKKGSAANAAHRVCLDSHRCLGTIDADGTEKPCPLQQAVDALNGLLLAERLCTVDATKCRKICAELEAANSRVWCEAPPFWIEDAESLATLEEECERAAQENAYWEGTV